ncbi:NUDIX hydrolase [Magnetococcus marinus MC-1]|uniref:NUDIX hydrolase n=1 Tax=Magnetococcus marinus (strain ATCC BAA-1437 / JCM 17883 / MC-1) TaxID=156889 RepID=A0LC04_MAGMM|nr:NUDIX hydrolase [Magnetococcus marinus]ABK45497.1 NUDIX hydrolase [Magnetococcus marinus MC-1]
MLVRATLSAHAFVMDVQPGQATRLLLVQLNYSDQRRHKWALPGGFVDQGETIEKALQREVAEEVALTLNQWQQFSVVPLLLCELPHVGFLFRCDGWQGTPRLTSRELCDLRWVDRETFNAMADAGELAYTEMRIQGDLLTW